MGTWVKKRFFLAVPVVVICVAAAVALSSREPTYKGRTMHEWLEQADNEHQYEALIILGTNNLPFLIRQIAYDPKRDRIFSCYSQLPSWLKPEPVTQRLVLRSANKIFAAEEAQRVLEVVGSRAAAAIPQLIKLAREKPPEVGERVVVVLRCFQWN